MRPTDDELRAELSDGPNMTRLLPKTKGRAAKLQGARQDTASLPEPYSDEDGARRFADRHLQDLRRCEEWSKWLLWDGTRWKQDGRLQALALVRTLCAGMASEARLMLEGQKGRNTAYKLGSKITASAIEQLSRADQRWAIAAEDLDHDPWLLNTPGGTVDLRTGTTQPHRREDLITKIVRVPPASAGTVAPKWEAFLRQVFADDLELIGYIRRLLGYSLTADTSEEMFAFAYGSGANGKGTLFNTFSWILGDYAMTAPLGMFMALKAEKHETELAQLVGRRLVIASEVEADAKWAETRIKALTGRDRVRARFMRQDFFEFEPVAKYIVFGNHRPNLKNADEAMRRRLHMIPFAVTIPAAERDHALRDKLKAEAPAILRWAIEGCLQWQSEGLKPPAKVKEATEAYLEAQDTFAEWLEEATDLDQHAREAFRHLYESWKTYADRLGEPPGSSKAFSAKLEDRGFERDRMPGTGAKAFKGLRVRLSAAPHHSDAL